MQNLVAAGEWVEAVRETIRPLLIAEATPLDAAVVLGAGFLALGIASSVAGRAQGLYTLSFQRSFFTCAVGIVVLLALLVPVRLLVLPKLDLDLARWGVPGAAGLILLIVVLPLAAKMQRATYIQGLINLGLGIVAAAAAVMLVNAALEATRHEKGEFSKIRKRTDDMNRFIQE